ncbi:MAG TPA: pentapeptide repeat-containing protein [Syntrophorhabdaceae bacterium]
MAREEHLALLNLGVKEWNGWRETHRDEAIDLNGAGLEKRDLRGIDFSRANLAKANFSGARLERANLSSAVLRDANLSHANLDHADLTNANLYKCHMAFARMENAVLPFASLRGADIRGAHLKGASLEDANLRKANCSHAHLEKAFLAFSDCTGADFTNANLHGANLTAVNLERANVSAVKFDDAVFWKVLKKARFSPRKIWKNRDSILLDTTMRCKGAHVACYGSQKFASFMKGQDFLEELMETRKGRIICAIWWLFADCGRSFVRWGFWSCMIIFLFGLAYLILGPHDFHLATLRFELGSMMYFSVVTFSTLGFGDIIPRTPVALFLTGLEVFTGYFMMGGLISIFATKLARAAR